MTCRVNMAINALNSMFFGTGRVGGVSNVESLSTLPLVQQDFLKNIIKRVKQLGPPPSDAHCQGAFAALQTAGSSYMDFTPGIGEVVNMKLNELSLPAGKVTGVSLSDKLTGPVKQMVVCFEDFMLQDATLWTDLEARAAEVQLYNDPLLKNRNTYLKFLSHLYKCGVLSFTNICRGRMGAFCALVGTDSAGIFWTLRAQPYPWRLCSAFAELAAITLCDSAVNMG